MGKKDERQDRILAILDADATLRVGALAARLDVSPETVRRDLADLAAAGRLSRTYGGAIRPATAEPALTERLSLHVAARRRIADAAVAWLAAERIATVALGGGASALHVARALRRADHALTVVTPAISVAQEVAANPAHTVMMLPGQVAPAEGIVHGAETAAALAAYRVDAAILGASGVDAEGTTDAMAEAAQTYAAMAAAATRVAVVADASKFGHAALRRVHRWDDRSLLICDEAPGRALSDRLGPGRVRVA